MPVSSGVEIWFRKNLRNDRFGRCSSTHGIICGIIFRRLYGPCETFHDLEKNTLRRKSFDARRATPAEGELRLGTEAQRDLTTRSNRESQRCCIGYRVSG
jgi:hypothetical protein